METIRFQDVTLTKEVEKAIADMGFEEMTPIQAMTIPPILDGRDVVGQAQTGTGKTIAFAIPIIEAVKQRSKRTHAIVLCPTREWPSRCRRRSNGSPNIERIYVCSRYTEASLSTGSFACSRKAPI